MIVKGFTFLVVVRILLLLVTMVVLAAIFGDKRLFFNQIILAIVLAIQAYELIRFVTRTNRELTKFFYAIRHSDFSITFKPGGLGKSFSGLAAGMTEIIASYKQVKIEKEAQFHFLQMLVNQLHIGIIAVDDDDHISLINPTAASLLGIEGMKNWKLVAQHNPGFDREVAALGGDGKKLVEIKTGREHRFLSVEARTLIILDRPMRLMTIQDINAEIEQKEIEAWHKLIRILTHEIMNSVTPIASLTETMQALLEEKGKPKAARDLRDETINDIRFSLDTIRKRSDGLLNFVENYRQLTRVPKPVIERVNVLDFLHGIEKLMSNELSRRKISLSIVATPHLDGHFDPMLLEQVLINMITNSIHALHETASPSIKLRAIGEQKHLVIEIADNGTGIPSRELSEIFVPFFSTKKEGSGIGLSLSKQIMSMHRGSIRVQSEPNAGTSFFLHLPSHSH